MNRILFWMLIVWLSIKWMFRITLGDDVIYQGKSYEVINGVCPSTWKLQQVLYGPTIEPSRKEVKKVWSIKGMVRSFKSRYSFYITSWDSIWVREGIKPWMKGCKIW